MEKLLKPIFSEADYPFLESIPESDTPNEPFAFVIPYSFFKSSAQGWRDFQPSNYAAQKAFMTLQFLAQAFQNPNIGTPSGTGDNPSLFFFKPTSDGERYTPKLRIFTELLVNRVEDDQGRALPLEELSIGNNIVGIRVWFHVHDPQYRPAQALQKLIRDNLRQVNPTEYEQKYGEATSGEVTEGSDTLASVGEDDMDVDAQNSGDGGHKNRKRPRSSQLIPAKTEFDVDELYMRISDMSIYGGFVADAYTDRNQTDSTQHHRTRGDRTLQHPGFNLDEADDHVHPLRVFSQSRAFEMARDLGVCEQQSTGDNYMLDSNDGEGGSGVWRFPVPRLVWHYEPKIFSPSALVRSKFPWNISRFDTMFRRYVQDHGLQQVYLGCEADNMQSNNENDMDERMFASINMIIGVAKQKEKLRDTYTEDDMRRVTNVMDERHAQLQKVTNYDDIDFRRLQRMFFEDALQEFQAIFDVSCNISQTLKAMLVWVEEVRWVHFCTERNTIDLEQGRYGHMVASDLLMFETYLLIAHVHRTQAEVFYARYDAFRDAASLHFNICQLGGPGSSKSVTTDNLEKCMVPGTVQRSDGMSAKAMTAAESDNDVARIFDEMSQTFVASAKKMSIAEKNTADLYKSIMTSGMANYEELQLIDDPHTGKRQRTLKRYHAERRQVFIGNSNALSHQADAAMQTRMRLLPAIVTERPFKHVVGLIAARFSACEQDNQKYMINFYRKAHFLNAVAWKLIQLRALPQPNIEVGNFETLLMLEFLNRNAFSVYSKVRSFERIQILSQLETVAFAVDVVFNSEISPLIQLDPETGEQRIKKFEYRDSKYCVVCTRKARTNTISGLTTNPQNCSVTPGTATLST